MSKAFTKETDSDDDELEELEPLPEGIKNYMTPASYAALQQELVQLQDVERPEVVKLVTWAASNGDRSENADYQYGKKRLREIDRRCRYLIKSIGSAEVVDPATQKNHAQVFFGATVIYAKADDSEQTVRLVGVDEADVATGTISWISPVARALLKARVGDTVELRAPSGVEPLEIIAISY